MLLLFSLAAAAAPALPPPVAPPADVGERALVVQPLHVMGDAAIWFAEEGWPVEAAVAEVVAKEGWDVVPVGDVQAAVARIDAGRLPDREGACSPILPAETWIEQAYDGASFADLQLRCYTRRPWFHEGPFAPGCVVRASILDGENHEVERHEATLGLGVTPADVAAAVRAGALRRVEVPPRMGGGVFGGLGSRERKPVRVRDLDTVGPWKPEDLEGLAPRLEALHAELAACSAGPSARFDAWGNPLQIAVGRDGRVERCERQFVDHHAEAGQACECGVVAERVRFSRARGERRLRMELDVEPLAPGNVRFDAEVSSALTVVATADPTAIVAHEGGSAAYEAVLACAREAGRLSTQRWPLAFVVGPDGRARSATVGLPLDGGDEALRACLSDAMTAARFTCPFTGEADVRAMLTLARMPRDSSALSKATVERAEALGVAVPRSPWVFEPGLPDATVLAVAKDGGVTVLQEGTATGEVAVVADAGAPLTALGTALRTRGPAKGRVYVAARTSADVVGWRFVVGVSPADAPVVTVAAGTPAPEVANRARADGRPTVFVGGKGATVADLLHAAAAAGAEERVLRL